MNPKHEPTLRPSLAGMILAACAFGGAWTAPLGAQIPDSYTNLQVLAENTTKPELLQVMKGFAADLGVRCAHCHVGPDNLEGMDFATDEKPQKLAAREMLRMVRQINSGTLPALPAREESRSTVTCYTCHRGAARPPRRVDDAIVAIALDEGAGAATRHFESLLEEHPMDGRFDLRPSSLGSAAQRLLEGGHRELARAIAAFNAEAHAEVAAAQSMLGVILFQLGDHEGATASFHRALELDPADGMARWGLQQIPESPS